MSDPAERRHSNAEWAFGLIETNLAGDAELRVKASPAIIAFEFDTLAASAIGRQMRQETRVNGGLVPLRLWISERNTERAFL